MSTEFDPVYLKVGDKVYINGLPKKGSKKIKWIVKSIDDRGNARMISSNNPNLGRNYPNVNILAGWLTREDGVQIIGRAMVREPLPPINTKKPSRYNRRRK